MEFKQIALSDKTLFDQYLKMTPYSVMVAWHIRSY